MIPTGLDRKANEYREENLRKTPGCDDENRHRVDNSHHVDVSEDLIELKQERHLQRCHGDIVDNHVRVNNLLASLDKAQLKTRNGTNTFAPSVSAFIDVMLGRYFDTKILCKILTVITATCEDV